MACAGMGIVAFLAAVAFGDLHAFLAAPLVLLPAGLVYLAIARGLGVPEAKILTNRLVAPRESARR
jgi:hypothetical protein